ncbi:MAG: DUF134 domain-containing protein [Bacteroidales bacterium]
MPRIRLRRKVVFPPKMEGFKPFGMPRFKSGKISLTYEEYESVRLTDYEGLTQAEASGQMGISRPTFTRIYEHARKIVATALIEGKTLIIGGGDFESDSYWYRCCSCKHANSSMQPASHCPSCHSSEIKLLHDPHNETSVNTLRSYSDLRLFLTNKEEVMMKIAIPTRANVVDDHFGHCEYYTIVSIDDNNQIINEESLQAPQGCGCKSNIASVLQEMGITVMLAGNMGQGALNKLSAHDIKVFRGCKGEVKQVISDFIAGKINDSGAGCSAHHEGHDHQCSHH